MEISHAVSRHYRKVYLAKRLRQGNEIGVSTLTKFNTPEYAFADTKLYSVYRNNDHPTLLSRVYIPQRPNYAGKRDLMDDSVTAVSPTGPAGPAGPAPVQPLYGIVICVTILIL
jgi:hypothetical protein